MSYVIFSEGWHDVLFLEQLYRQVELEGGFARFNNEESETRQTNRLTQHEIDSTRRFLYKAEGGRSKLFKMFADAAPQMYERVSGLNILMDLDNEPITDVVSEINRQLRLAWGSNNFKISELNSDREMLNDLYLLNFDLVKKGSSITQIKVAAFYDELETEAGIVYGEAEDQKVAKLSTYINSNSDDMDKIATWLHS